MKNSTLEPETTTTFLTASDFLRHWQGHRQLTRRVIEAFPEDKLFSYSVGGMRPFAVLAMEMMGMAVPGVKGVASGKWEAFKDAEVPKTKAALLSAWDQVTADLDKFWSEIPAHRFSEVDVAFGQYENTNFDTLLYFIDNEIHHRGQGYVYLRSLGIEPPAFWER